MPFLLLEMDTIKRTASQNFYPTNIFLQKSSSSTFM